MKYTVIQAAILGPVLLIIYLNDININNSQHTEVTLLADDTSFC